MSMAYVAVAVAVVAAGMSAYTAYSGAENAKEAADYNKKVADNAALDSMQRGSIEASEHRQKVRQMIARQNASFASGGLDPTTGTPLDITTDTAGMGELDALRLINNAQRGAAGFKAQGDIEGMKGDAARQAQWLNTTSSTLSSASSSYYGSKQAGMWGKK